MRSRRALVLFSEPVTPFDKLVRGVAVVLLLFAATDLSFPAGCAETLATSHADLALSTSDDVTTPSHSCDDCFCCSRTVVATTVTALVSCVNDAPVPAADSPQPPPAVGCRLYHPPIA